MMASFVMHASFQMYLVIALTICIPNWLHPEEKQSSYIIMTRGGFATWRKVPTDVRLLPCPRNRVRGTIFCEAYISKAWLSGLWESHAGVRKLTKAHLTKGLSSFQRIYIHFEEMRKYKFSKAKALRKWRGRKSLKLHF